ncbi:Hcn4 [Symbiodinium sp. CCMP2592]|nr:Hcn4 [Symbiodinium sp. CCMP2592]
MAGFVGSSWDALDSLQLEIDQSYERVTAKLDSLRTAGSIFEVDARKSGASPIPDAIHAVETNNSTNLGGVSQQPSDFALGTTVPGVDSFSPSVPSVLLAYDSSTGVGDSGVESNRLYSKWRTMSGRPEEDSASAFRLHGRWMQLSTHCSGFTIGHETVRRLNTKRSFNISDQGFEEPFCRRPLHPEGNFRICWDFFSLFLLLTDAILLPVSLAWDWKMSFDDAGSAYLALSIWCSLVFWTADIFVNLNTAIYIKGKLTLSRAAIFWRYLKTWLILDVTLVSLDFFNMGYIGPDFEGDLTVFRAGRVVRVFRVFRLLRLLKMTKLDEITQEIAASTGRQWIMLVMAVFNSAVVTMLVAHIVTCVWFWIGKTVWDEGHVSWIHLAEAENLGASVQYIHAIRYVMNPPAPPAIMANSGRERLFDILNFVFTLVVIGGTVSKISGTLAELRAMNESRARQKREIRVYLTHQDASFELVSRIMRFVDYKLEKNTPISFDSSLISITLQTELYVNQRGKFLESVPVFGLTKQAFPDCFASICAALVKNVFEKKECVFTAGAVANSMYLTATGTYIHTDSNGAEETFTGEHWFEEMSLYAESMVHHSTLTSKTFGEIFTLDGKDLVDCLQNSPASASMFCGYAKAFVEMMQKPTGLTVHGQQLVTADSCCRHTRQYQELYPDPKTRLDNISIVHDVLGPDIQTISESTCSFRSGGLAHMLKDLDRGGLQPENIIMMLQNAIPELHPDVGTHALLEQLFERDRAVSSCVSLLALVYNDYNLFVKPQLLAPVEVTTPDQWKHLRELVTWVKPTPEQLQAVLVLLAIRGLGKSTVLMNQIRSSHGRPEQVVLYLIKNAKNVVPSTQGLGEKALGFIENTLLLHEVFNLAQMLQGENVPANVAQLQERTRELGEEVFHFYVLFLIGFMSGLGGGHGSKFLHSRHAQNFIASMQMLRHLMDSSPSSIYWGYIACRARVLRAPLVASEDLALMRLACLGREQDRRGYIKLQKAWALLGSRERATLVHHLLADGIQRRAIILEFLPDCVQKSKTNAAVGLTRLFEVMVDLLDNLSTVLQQSVEKVVLVDLSDLKNFIEVVQNSFVFSTCISRCKLRRSEERVSGQMGEGNVRMNKSSLSWFWLRALRA